MKELLSKLLYLSIITLILCLGGCGIPNFYVPDSSDYSISSSSHRITLSGDMVDSSLVKDSYPRLALFYQIVPNGYTSGFSSAITYFSSSYCSSTNGQRISASSSQPYFYHTYTDSTIGTDDYGVYQFSISTSSSDINAIFQYADLTSSPSSIVWNLDFELDTTDYSLDLRITDSDENELSSYKLYRYNGRSFSQNLGSNNLTYINNEVPDLFNSYLNSITDYTLKIYAIVTTEFNEYSNIFNTTISPNGPIYTVSLGLQ